MEPNELIELVEALGRLRPLLSGKQWDALVSKVQSAAYQAAADTGLTAKQLKVMDD